MPALATLLSQGFRLADRLLPESAFPVESAEQLVRAAGVAPSPDALAGLERLLDSIRAESALSLFGRVSLHWDFLRLLRNASLIEAAHASNPALSATPVKAPLFILGLPRSGTSFLHSLLAEDPANQVPRNWQMIYPAPRPPGFSPRADKRVGKVDKQLELFNGLAPGFRELHPITADSPQECSEITAHVFQSLRFDSTHRVPSYFDWLEAHGHDDAFRFHKKFLQYLQAGEPARWVLKCPDHTFTLSAILRVYPDARFVILHRDPIAVLGSVAHLTQVLRQPFLREIDAGEIGAQVAARWTQGANLLLEFDRRTDVPAAAKFHMQYEEFTADPVLAVERIYAHFGEELTEPGLQAMRRMAEAKPRGGYGRHAPYRLEAFKLSVPALQKAFSPYVQQYCQAAR
ncbi:sulfotransferase [Acidocella sp.]|uniref:sulfotransferase family protein n=1 Tax=Acidocella sp. TaxID=50710 RepID=UPI00263856DD|nr:sulfotransferase [Acidocella sp.]